MPHHIYESPHSWIFSSEYPEGADNSLDDAIYHYEKGNLDKAEELIRKLLLVCPDHIDALHHLSIIFSEYGLNLESYLCTREAVRIGLEAFPPKFSWQTSRLIWDHLSNRPFMRAYHALGLLLIKSQEVVSAAEIFSRLVAINPNDNLGARYILMQCYLDMAEWEAAISLCKQYPEDSSPDIAYSKVVALFQAGQDAEALMSLTSAIHCSPSIAAELVKSKHTRPRSEFSGRMTIGGEDEAFDYWERNRSHWSSNKKSHKALKRLLGGVS
jgi:tetratricopeptide (TPR) repeat protein